MKTRPLPLHDVFSDFLTKIKIDQTTAKQIDATIFSAIPPENPYLQVLAITKQNTEQLRVAIEKLQEIKCGNLQQNLKDAAEQAFLEYGNLIRHLLSREFFLKNEIDDKKLCYSMDSYIRLNKNLELLLPIVENLNKVLISPADSDALESLANAATAANDEITHQEKAVANAKIAQTMLCWTAPILATAGVILLLIGSMLILPIVAGLGLGGPLLVKLFNKIFNPDESLSTEKFNPVVSRAQQVVGLFGKSARPENNEGEVKPLLTATK